MTDKELARKVGRGDAEAAETFAREHYPAVLRLACRLCGQREEAEDIAQETFLVARRKIETFRGAQASERGSIESHSMSIGSGVENDVPCNSSITILRTMTRGSKHLRPDISSQTR